MFYRKVTFSFSVSCEVWVILAQYKPNFSVDLKYQISSKSIQ